MLSVVAMSSSNTLLSSSFTSEVSSTSNDKNLTPYRIKREPSSEGPLDLEEGRNTRICSSNEQTDQTPQDIIPLKSKCVKNDITSIEEQCSEIKVRDGSSSPPPPQLKPKKSFMTSHILGDIESTRSVSPIPHGSPSAIALTSSIACSMASPNGSNLSSNEASPHSSNRGSVCSPTNSMTSKTTSPMSSPPSSTFSQTPLLFQPFLPFQHQQSPIQDQQSQLHHLNLKNQPSRTHPNVPQMVQRALPFSIDNILKPTFGCGNDEASAVASHLFSPFLGASLASSILHHHHQQQQSLLQQAAAAHAVSAAVSAAANSNLKENSFSNLNLGALSQFPPSAFTPRGSIVSPSGSSLSSPRSPTYSSSTLQPLGNSKSKVFKIKQEPPPPSKSPEKGTLPKDAVVRKNSTNTNQPVDLSKSSGNDENEGKDDDVPPGMVRGPNGQLWPAWVFCTRYSDRPSSGKLLLIPI